MSAASPRLYHELAGWWPLLSPPSHYPEEAEDLLNLIGRDAPGPRRTLLELGSGGGSLAFHLKPWFTLTLTDLSEDMLAVNRAVNPECQFAAGDMRTIRLGRQFDVVLIHDAIMYLTDEPSLRAALENAARHTRPGGVMVLLPDCVAETFESSTSQGGEDAPDGRGLRYLDWSWDPDPTDTKFETVYAFLLRDAGGEVRAELDRHTLGLFPRATWVKLLEDNGLSVTVHQDPWNRDVFLARRAGSSNSTPADVARGAGVPAGQTP